MLSFFHACGRWDLNNIKIKKYRKKGDSGVAFLREPNEGTQALYI